MMCVCVCVSPVHVCQLEHASAKVCLEHSSIVLLVEALVEDSSRNVVVAASDLKSTRCTLPEVAVQKLHSTAVAFRPQQRAQWAAWYIWPSTMTVRHLTS